MPLRYPEPRPNPLLRQHAWKAAARRRRLWTRAGIACAAAACVFLLALLPVDRTSRLSPEEVARAAGKELLKASAYRFDVELEGESADGYFPQARMSGAFQRDPPVLHLNGEARTGDRRVPLEYYLEGADLYVKDPGRQDWMLMRYADLDQLRSFQPNTLALPLVSGVKRAAAAGRERLAGGEALVLDLELAPEHRPRLGPQGTGAAVYRLWVYTRSLKPARLMIGYKAGEEPGGKPGWAGEAAGGGDSRWAGPTGTAGLAGSPTRWFSYSLTWDFSRSGPLAVPAPVKQGARDPGGR